MREIKFRAWTKAEQKMYRYVEHTTYADGSNGVTMLVDTDGYSFAPNESDIELMQYTGLKDAKGKEIYEGDILRIPGNYVGYGTHNAVVEWSDKELGWSTSSGLKMTHYYDAPTELEIIGNIHDNPELLPDK
jgi:uncharacterized phage protein (TIGR01671 family)